jgi:hypothetical protein
VAERPKRLADVHDGAAAGAGAFEALARVARAAGVDELARQLEVGQHRRRRVGDLVAQARGQPGHGGDALGDHQPVEGALELLRLRLARACSRPFSRARAT